jgi:predicted  nucleic acid-binding Zn-ribbon protein
MGKSPDLARFNSTIPIEQKKSKRKEKPPEASPTVRTLVDDAQLQAEVDKLENQINSNRKEIQHLQARIL